ncbi:MAG: flagellar biosynthetic protein FliR [Lachnospiraceae bacterium]|nr:flagellar biosynthetic protein FliR [Lachnospiraceae bacterium]
MLEQSFSIYHVEYFLAILVRVMGAMALAPIFANQNVTNRAKLFIGIAIAFAIFNVYSYVPLNYTTFIEYTVILLKELMVGLTIGFTANITLTILNMAGQFIDREMGFSMVSNFDPTMNTDATITAQFYNMLAMVLMLCTNMHYFVISALADSFTLIPLGNVVIDSGTILDKMVQYMTNYFTIALRICLPMLIVIMLLNVVLGVLAKTAPQMNMFVVGIQLKVFSGFAVLVVTIGFLPNIVQFIYDEMRSIVVDILKAFYV